MFDKTTELRQRFNLPATEQVVQDYYCSLKKSVYNHGGRLWITQNYVCFYSGLPFKISEKLSFRKITQIERPSGILKNNIDITFDEGKGVERKIEFGAFLKTTETL